MSIMYEYNYPYGPITTERLLLKTLTDDDIESVYRQFSDKDMCRYTEPPCDRAMAQFIIDHYKKPEGAIQLRWGIFDRLDGTFIGTCGYHFYDARNSKVEIGYDIWKDHWRKGYASEVMPVLLRACFKDLGVHCVYAHTHSENEASRAVLKKYGFHFDGILRGWARYGDESVDQTCYTLLKSEYRP